jgi:hypothetical protein
MTTEWTADRRGTIKRNLAIQGRNRFFEQFNTWFGTHYPPKELEPVPSTEHDTELMEPA